MEGARPSQWAAYHDDALKAGEEEVRMEIVRRVLVLSWHVGLGCGSRQLV
jgi:hypothetical protein